MEEKKSFWRSSSARWFIVAIAYIVEFGVISFCNAIMSNGLELLVVIPTAVFTYFGWKALNRIQPSMFLWMSWAGWFAYIFIKFFLAVLVGAFVTPWVLGNNIANHLRSGN